MRRRELLAGLGGLTAVGVGATIATRGAPFGDDDRVDPVVLPVIDWGDDDPNESGDGEGNEDGDGDGEGNEDGDDNRVTVPREGEVTFLEVFATWCGTCQEMMPTLADVHDSVGDDVQFVSVTNEPLDSGEYETVTEWWAEHGGTWRVAHDGDLRLTERVDARSVPYSVVFDANNRITWSHRGAVDGETVERRIDEAIERRIDEAIEQRNDDPVP